ncbi:stable inheritance protein KleA [Pseudomonas sp. CFBP 13602]|uniref:stable inheritance protein KleA n=1 Tax=Pseudomonas sp. CFBP 13602 TaxID=2774039 RepID=UPI0017869DCF|nr:stable inheritance protein KleA [Pseudomonas sp. CFBP 13602]MBD8828988.1 stable inheritance protein KleA [Pseudomonas sp. CFBP 13602]
MNHQLIMPWIDLLPGVGKTDLQQRRDTIQELSRQAAEATHNAQILVRKAKELRERASLAACTLEGDAKGKFSADTVEKAKNLANPPR